MADEPKLSKLEHLKANSRQLRGTIAEELANDADHFSGDAMSDCSSITAPISRTTANCATLKDEDGNPLGKSYMFMVRTRIPGGKVSAEQFLAELDLCDQFGNGTLRITTRQGFQLHGVVRDNLRETIRAINRTKLTTLAACGDVERERHVLPGSVQKQQNPR